jgi:hypothetical protein
VCDSFVKLCLQKEQHFDCEMVRKMNLFPICIETQNYLNDLNCFNKPLYEIAQV